MKGDFHPFVSGEHAELRQLAVRSAGVTLFSGFVTLAIQVIATAILARILTPADFGLVTMVTTFSLLLANCGLNGLTEAIVQCEEITHDLASTLFWINLVCGLLLTIGFAATGSLLAKFFHDPLVKRVTQGLSLTILATSISVIHLALLKRAMLFSAVSMNDIYARVASVAVSIALGWMGWGYWALVGGAVAMPLTSGIGAWFFCRWIPGRPKREVANAGSVLKFAIHTYGNFGANYFSRNTDNLLVGWRFNAQALGFYKKAYDLFALSAGQFAASITIVAVSALSRVRQDSAKYKRSFLGGLTVMAFIGMALGAVLTLTGRDMIRVLLGPKWEPAGRIFTFFGPGIGAMLVYYTTSWLHLSIGRADRWFRWAILEFAVTCTLLVAGVRFGPVGVASAWTLSFWLLTIPGLWYAGKPIRLGITTMLAVVWRYALASLLAGCATEAIIHAIPTLGLVQGVTGAAARIVVISLLLGLLYPAFVVLLHGGLEPLYQIVRILRELLPRRKSSTVPYMDATSPDAGFVELAPIYKEEGISIAMPLVSILIPAHNSEAWIETTIRSALAQTWPQTEIIVVDDGSTDQTGAIARQFESQGVLVVEQKNQGASAARNKAYSLSHGEYIQWLDADDLLAPDKIARQMEIIKEGIGKRTLLSSSWGRFIYCSDRAEFTHSSLWCDLSPLEWLLRKMGQNIFMQTSTWLVSRELSEAAGPWDTRLLGDDDGEYFCRVVLASEGVRFVPESKVYYRSFQSNSLSHVGRSSRKIDAHWLSMRLHVQYLRSRENSPRVRSACLQFLQDSLIYFYPERPDIVKEAEQIASELGGHLGTPPLSWKYSWIQTLFGWGVAKPVQLTMRNLRWSVERRWDRLLFQIEGGK